MEVGGSDAEGREYRNAKEMWREEIGEGGENKKEWYQKGVGYWEGIEASVDGVLGGYGHVNDPDVKGSEAFLKALLANRIGGVRPNNLVALDCGSGIGRVTGNLLLRYFNEVDLVEPVSHFLEAAREKLAPEKCITNMHRAVNFYCVPLQEFTPEVGRYDVIWVQWCIGHLADDDFVAFFKRAKAGLKPHGFFVLKENVAKDGFLLDKEDKSITRCDLYFKELFNQCGLHLLQTKVQRGLPKELFAVRMYALVTNTPKTKIRMQSNSPAIIK
ncbi:alpha amino-terminal protein methyltransferase isoform X1 [Tasmannia lanceolata]|uniref:alpha amino-terminal protein methyltransferase isoform X1 n=1 Tax=Tasmannia lanceolata TaxID=3420 RepID=UPI004062AE94